MKILSLFDGISAAQQAFKNLSIEFNGVDNIYYSSEIDKYAIKNTQHNFPNTVQLGDVAKVNSSDFNDIDLVIGGSPCFVADTKILTSVGYKEIKDVQVGDYVLTHTNKFQKVLKIGNCSKDTIIVNSQGFLRIETTNEHPFYVSEMVRIYSKRAKIRTLKQPIWKKAIDLKEDDFLGLPIIQEEENNLNITQDEAWIIGRYIADGHTRKDYRKEKGREQSRHYGLILSIGKNKIGNIPKLSNKYSLRPHTESTYRAIFCSKRLVDIVEEHCGCGALNKKISTQLLKLPKELLAILLDGYFSGDGSYNKKTDFYKCTTVSQDLIMSLSLAIAKSYNVGSNVIKTIRPKTYVIQNRIVNQNDTYSLSFCKNIKKQSNFIVKDNFIWFRFKEMLQTNIVKTVYNIEVENDNSYTANNCTVHNCQSFSVAGNQKGFEDPRGQLFLEYIRILNEVKPKYFVFENVNSMSKANKDIMTSYFGFEPTLINSSLITAQNRKRIYFVGALQEDGTYKKIDISQPEDKHIYLKDILETGLPYQDKSHALTASYDGAVFWNSLEKKQRTMVVEPVLYNQYNERTLKDKSGTLSTCSHMRTAISGQVVFEPVCVASRGRNIVDGKRQDILGAKTEQRLEPNLNGKTNTLTTVAKDNMVLEAVRLGHYNKGGQGDRIYSVEGKSVCLSANGGGRGAKTGLYKIDLPDGDYVVRKLTVNECCRLQDFPDGFVDTLSKTQGYKALGNSFTVGVIEHILKHLTF